LFGFGDEFASLPLAGMSLDERQKQAVAHAGCRLFDIADPREISEDRFILFDDDLFFTPEAAAFVAQQARTLKRSADFVLRDNAFNRRFRLPEAADERREEAASGLGFRDRSSTGTETLVIPQHIFPNHGRVPPQIVPGGRFELDQCAVLATRLITPFHLLQANVYLLMARGLWLRRLVPSWLERGSRYQDSWLHFKSLRLLNQKGRGCKIHPTAVVEGVEMADDVTIGAYAVVRMSRLGSGTIIEDQASVLYSVLGDNNFIANKNHVAFCMTFDDVFLIHGPYQFSIFGRGSAVFAVINCDIRMDQKTIRIDGPDGVIDSRQHLLGIAYGHGAKVAGGNIIAPGRIIPNEQVKLPPDFMLR